MTRWSIVAVLLSLVATAPRASAGVLTGSGEHDIAGEDRVFWSSPNGAGSIDQQGFFDATAAREWVELPLPAGTLRELRLLVKNGGQATGRTRIRLYKNGVGTKLGCAVRVVGSCTSSASVVIAAGDRIALRVASNIDDLFFFSATLNFSYSLRFD